MPVLDASKCVQFFQLKGGKQLKLLKRRCKSNGCDKFRESASLRGNEMKILTKIREFPKAKQWNNSWTVTVIAVVLGLTGTANQGTALNLPRVFQPDDGCC